VEEACDATIHVTERFSPEPEDVEVYNRCYPVYRGLYEALKGEFRRIAGLPAS
jgi:hypothetical protein